MKWGAQHQFAGRNIQYPNTWIPKYFLENAPELFEGLDSRAGLSPGYWIWLSLNVTNCKFNTVQMIQIKHKEISVVCFSSVQFLDWFRIGFYTVYICHGRIRLRMRIVLKALSSFPLIQLPKFWTILRNLLNTEFCKWRILEYCRNCRGVTYVQVLWNT